MPVEITAPQAWEFQYHVTAFLGLLYADTRSISFIVEKHRGEDAELRISGQTPPLTVEIQCKSSHKETDLATLVSWLDHFPPQTHSENFLSRLIGDPFRLALFVSAGRCRDETRGFVRKPSTLRSNSADPMDRGTRAGFLNELRTADANAKAGTVGARRATFSAELARRLEEADGQFQELLRRILIWENTDQARLEDDIRNSLNRRFHVPPSRTDVVRLQLLDAVKKARDVRGDVMPAFRQILDEARGDRILPGDDHIPRASDATLLASLRAERVLFLTGRSQCGKTHTARFLAQAMQDAGFHVQECQDIPEARRFLSQSSEEDRLCLLEDPFGHIEIAENAPERWQALADLIARLPPHRLLIVTSKREILHLASPYGYEDRLDITGHHWHDLTVSDRQFLLSVWEQCSAGQELSRGVSKILREGINTQSTPELLQPGQLHHLANSGEMLEGKSFSDLCEIARFDAANWGNYLFSRGTSSRLLHCALALGATTVTGIGRKDLAYILSTDGTCPGLHPENDWTRADFAGETPPPQFPQYEDQLEIEQSMSNEIEYLRQRRHVSSRGAEIVFTHPDYRAASLYVLLRELQDNPEPALLLLKKSLACLSNQSSLNSARMLRKIYTTFNANAPLQNRVVEIALDALRSVFPAVRDTALLAVLDSIDRLGQENQQRIFEYVRSANALPYLEWEQGMPWICSNEVFSYSRDLKNTAGFLNEPQFLEIMNRFRNPNSRSTVTSEEAWGVLLYAEHNDTVPLCRDFLLEMLAHDEAFIRAEAVSLMTSRLLPNAPDALDVVFSDEHPSVVGSAIIAGLRSWDQFSPDIKNRFISAVVLALQKVGVAVVLNRLFLSFSDEHSEFQHRIINWAALTADKRKDLWSVWARCVPTFLRTVSRHVVHLDTAQLWLTARDSCQHISPEAGCEVANAWMEWNQEKLRSGMLDEYALSASEYLLAVSDGHSELRRNQVRSLLSETDTGYLTMIVRGFVDHWNVLDAEERLNLIELITGPRNDARWLRAVALTRKEPPTEVMQALLKTDTFAGRTAEECIPLFPSTLLLDSLAVWCGHPQPLWWYGYHHSSNEIWPKIIAYSMQHSESLGFQIALREVLSDHLNGGHQEWPDAAAWWESLCQRANAELRRTLCEELLRWTARINGALGDTLWKAFFPPVKDPDEYSQYLGRIVDNIEAISNNRDYLWEVFGKDRFQNDLLPRLPADNLLFHLYPLLMGQENNRAAATSFVGTIQSLYEKSPPRIWLLHSLLRDWLAEVSSDIAAPCLQTVQQAITKHLDRASKQRNSFDDHYELPDWNASPKQGQ